MKAVLIYTSSWFGLVLLAILNGAVREKFYGQFMLELSAHQLSTFIGIALFGVYIWMLTGVWRIESSKQAFTVGGIWLILTVVFEFVFAHFAMGHTWEKLFDDYNLLKGRVWVLVLIWTTAAPYIFYRLRP